MHPPQKLPHLNQKLGGIIPLNQVSGVGDRDGGAVGYHLLHPLHSFIGENIAPVSPQYQRGAINLSHTVPQLLRSPSWQPGRPFPTGQLTDAGGFLGLDGAFRFSSDGTAQRALEVREVRDGQVVVVSPAPESF